MERKQDICELIRNGKLSLPPVRINVIAEEFIAPTGDRADMQVDAQWEGQSVRFIAEVKRLSNPKAIRQAILWARQMANPPETYPMIIVPYLSAEKLDMLEAEQVSGLDLCGNGVLKVPGKLLVFRAGQTNQFPQSAKVRNAYRGKNSIVARAFLLRSQFSKVKDIVQFLKDRGGGVAFSTVSKVLQRLENDLIISREAGPIRLIQADTLMDNLAANYEQPMVTEQFRGKCDLPREEMIRRLYQTAKKRGGRLVLTGTTSAGRFAVMGGEPVISLYCTDKPTVLLADASINVKETDRFSNVHLMRTIDDRVFFDTAEEYGAPYASPVQVWLELIAGDKRQKDAAQQVKRGILDLSSTP